MSCPDKLSAPTRLGYKNINQIRSIWDLHPINLARHFGQPAGANKLAGMSWCRKATGAPVLSNALAYFDCRLRDQVSAGDHDLVIGQVVDGQILRPGVSLLVYREGAHLDGSQDLFPNHFSE
ncbi:MAG: flavin reductase family protein [Gammaproteobacteria bacterium]